MGNLLTEAFYGTEGEPVISTKGYALKQDTYDIRGHLLTEEYSDGNGTLLMQARVYADRVLDADPGLQEPRNELLLKELRKDKYDIKDYSKIS